MAKKKVVGSSAPDAFYLGRYWDGQTGQIGPEISTLDTKHTLIVAPNRRGKDAAIIVPNVLTCDGNKNQVFQDTRREVAAIVRDRRRAKHQAGG